MSTAVEAMLFQKTFNAPYNGPALYYNSDKPVSSSQVGAQVSGTLYVVSQPPPSTLSDLAVHLLVCHRAGAVLEIRVDGAVSNSISSAAVASTDVSSPSVAAIIGGNGYGTQTAAGQEQVQGDIAEMVGVHGSLTAAELANLESYLMTRYAIP
jgi:hypothetical protein